MKEYQLNSPEPKSHVPAFVERCAKWAKATNEICGLIRGLLADGAVSEGEARYFRDWVKARPELLRDPLFASLVTRVDRVFADGIVTSDELIELKDIFTEYAGPEETPTTLPLDKPAPKLQIKGQLYCFTGKFLSGTRDWCCEQIESRGGRTTNTISTDLSVLVIGSKVSHAWANQTYGRKIESAVGVKQEGYKLAIVVEDHWLTFLA